MSFYGQKRKCIVLLIHTNNNLLFFILLLLSKYSFSIGKTAGGFCYFLFNNKTTFDFIKIKGCFSLLIFNISHIIIKVLN